MALRTYLLAPNFTFELDGPICIGNIIADPFYPMKLLSKPLNAPPTTTHTDFDCSFSQNNNKSLQGNVWMQFLQNINGNFTRRVSRDVSSEYTMDSLETIRVKEEPSDEEVMKRIREPRVQATMKAGLRGAAPVYMITGLKIAHGFRLNKMITKCTQKAGINLGLPAAAGVSVGADVSVSHSNDMTKSFRSGNSIIFAYQLHILARKSWWHKQIKVDVYAPRSAFLNTDVSLEKEEEVSARCCQYSDLVEIASENEYPPLEVLKAFEGGIECNSIILKEI